MLGPSGCSAHLRQLAAAAARAHPVRLVAASSQDRRGPWADCSVPTQTVKVPGWPSWLPRHRERRETWTARRVAKTALGGTAPRLIYERWTLFSEVGAQVRRRHGSPWVLEVNAPLVRERARFEQLHDPRYAETWQHRVLQQPDRLVAVSPWLGRWLVDEQGVPPERVRVVRNGSALAEHSVTATQRAELRRSLGLQDQLVMGFVGSMKPWHGLSWLPELLAALPEASLMLLGPPPPPELRGPRVYAPGYLRGPALAAHVAAMDVMLVPYPQDAPPWFCPLKAWDGLAMGTPVLASGACMQDFPLAEGGEVLPAGDLSAWTGACRRWRGRRAPPQPRSWQTVWSEATEGLLG